MLLKRYFGLIIGLLFAALSVAQENLELAILVAKKDGASYGYCLDKFPVIELSEEGLKISCNNVTDYYLWDELFEISYVDRNELPDKISKLKNNDLTVLFFDDGIRISTKKRRKISIYDISGKNVLSNYIEDNSTRFIKYSDFSSGVYVIKTDNRNFKFFVK